MKKIIFLMSLLLFLVLVASPTLAGKRASVKWGEELYKSPSLGSSTNEKSCRSCHKKNDKKMLKKVMKMSKDELNTVINRCIADLLKGKALDPESEEIRAVRMYLNFLTDDCYE